MHKGFYLAAAAAVLALSSAANAGTFNNGSFESGDFTGWTAGGGYWDGTGGYPTPAQYLPGGTKYNASGIHNSITSAGFDPRTDNNLRTVYAGDHSARVNDPVNDYTVSAITQTVVNYTDSVIAFAYAAVLQDSHGTTDSDAFIITLKDITQGDVLFSLNVNSAATPGSFTRSNSGWYYTDWTDVSIDVSSRLGNTFELTLLANDCPYGGHAGYAYLDGFGSVVGGGGTPVDPGAVPEPATWAMMIAGFGIAGAAMRRRKTSVAFA